MHSAWLDFARRGPKRLRAAWLCQKSILGHNGTRYGAGIRPARRSQPPRRSNYIRSCYKELANLAKEFVAVFVASAAHRGLTLARLKKALRSSFKQLARDAENIKVTAAVGISIYHLPATGLGTTHPSHSVRISSAPKFSRKPARKICNNGKKCRCCRRGARKFRQANGSTQNRTQYQEWWQITKRRSKCLDPRSKSAGLHRSGEAQATADKQKHIKRDFFWSLCIEKCLTLGIPRWQKKQREDSPCQGIKRATAVLLIPMERSAEATRKAATMGDLRVPASLRMQSASLVWMWERSIPWAMRMPVRKRKITGFAKGAAALAIPQIPNIGKNT